MDKLTAEKQGKKLLDRMTCYGGWKLRVWENLGWHYAIYKNGMNIHPGYNKPNETPKYYALFGRDDRSGGEIFWSDKFRDSDPNVVVMHQLSIAQQFITNCQKAVNGIILDC